MKKKNIGIFTLITVMAFTALVSGCSTEATGNSKNDRVPTIGINQFAMHPSLDNCTDGFIQGLEQEGFVDGETINLDLQNSMGDTNKGGTISSAFASKKYDIVCGVATPAAQSVYNAVYGKDIPALFMAVSDPVAAQLVEDMESPGNQCTGTSDALPIEAQLKMMRAFLPDAKTVGILYTTSEVNSESHIAIYKELAAEYDFEIVTQGVTQSTDIPSATDAILKNVDCLTMLTDNNVVSSLKLIVDKANAAGIPVFGSEEEQLKSGCIGSEGLDYVALGIETGKIAARILNGENVADIPVKVIDDSKPVVNNIAAELLGIEIPAEYADATNIETE